MAWPIFLGRNSTSIAGNIINRPRKAKPNSYALGIEKKICNKFTITVISDIPIPWANVEITAFKVFALFRSLGSISEHYANRESIGLNEC